MQAGEEVEVCSLVTRVFSDFVSHLYSPEGIKEFFRYADPALLSSRTQDNHFVLVAELHGQIVGMIEMRNNNHISLFFIEGELQRKGIGKQLWRKALDTCLANRPDLAKITVHSSPNAVEAYQRLEFQAEGPEQIVNGIRFVPMAFNVKKG
jgi:GNAT superfamily N-acetyltransferase